MIEPAQPTEPSIPLKWSALILALVWTVGISMALGWHLWDLARHTEELASIHALGSFEKDMVYRRWAASHGGVYVPVTETTPPNPYLSHIENRDVTTTSGLDLTLMNPAYMTRQVHEMGREEYDHQAHITSLNPLRPENIPDSWEREVLHSFEDGVDEVVELASIDGVEYLRFMRPMVTEAACLKCHASQGYEEGDLRGGISVSVPMAPLWAIQRGHMRVIAMSYGALLLFGLGSVWFGVSRVQHRIDQTLRAKAALKVSEERFRALFENAPLGYQSLDEDGTFLEVNNTWCQALGYSRGEVVGRNFTEFLHPDQHGKYRENFPEFLRRGFIRDVQFDLLKKDGTLVKASFDGKIGRKSDGSFEQTHCVFEDVTELREMEQERERLLRAIEQAQESILITDVNGVIQYINPVFEEITGYSRDEVIGQNPRILKSGEHDDAFYKGMWDTLLQGETWSGQLVNKKKDGTLFTEAATISPVRDSSGETVNYVAVKRDITEKIRLEEQFRLAQKVESIGRLAGGVSHDLNNLLLPILGYSEMLLDDQGPTEDRREFVEQIRNAGLRARDLVRQLLAFSRKQTLDYRPVDMNCLLSDFQALLRRTIREDIELDIVACADLPAVMADTGQIEQVIMNLAVNSSDAMPAGGRLTFETSQVELDQLYADQHPDVQPGSFVLLAISDTGCGMDKQTVDKIFEPFFSTKGRQGTGLGLATVYGIVKQHGGNIWVYSEPGQGTTFKIYLPVSIDGVEMESFSKAVVDYSGSETILLVEDDAQVRDLAETILQRQGYTVLVSESGPQALQMLGSTNGGVDLLLTDVVMPEMNGKDLFEKSLENNPKLKVLYMSGYTDDVIARRGILEKDTAFIQKPFTVQDLNTKVREVLESR